MVKPKPGREDRFTLGRNAFLTEARTLNTLPRQRGLVRIAGAFEKHATVYALMEFIDGESLETAARRVIAKRGHIPEVLLRDLLEALLGALDTVHRVGVLHRDIKPANIMFRRTSEPVLIDFGAARPMTRSTPSASMFSRRYAALEQFPTRSTGYRPRFEDGPTIDIFALSVMLYELLSQSLPPDAEERFKALKSTGRDPYLPVRQNLTRNRITASYPDVLLDAIDAGCALFPEDRVQSAADMAQRLAGFLPEGGGKPHEALLDPLPDPVDPQPRRAGSTTEWPAPQKRGGGGTKLVLGIILLLAAASVGLGIYWQ